MFGASVKKQRGKELKKQEKREKKAEKKKRKADKANTAHNSRKQSISGPVISAPVLTTPNPVHPAHPASALVLTSSSSPAAVSGGSSNGNSVTTDANAETTPTPKSKPKPRSKQKIKAKESIKPKAGLSFKVKVAKGGKAKKTKLVIGGPTNFVHSASGSSADHAFSGYIPSEHAIAPAAPATRPATLPATIVEEYDKEVEERLIGVDALPPSTAKGQPDEKVTDLWGGGTVATPAPTNATALANGGGSDGNAGIDPNVEAKRLEAIAAADALSDYVDFVHNSTAHLKTLKGNDGKANKIGGEDKENYENGALGLQTLPKTATVDSSSSSISKRGPGSRVGSKDFSATAASKAGVTVTVKQRKGLKMLALNTHQKFTSL